MRRLSASCGEPDVGRSRVNHIIRSRVGADTEKIRSESRRGGLHRPVPFYPVVGQLPSRSVSVATQVLAC